MALKRVASKRTNNIRFDLFFDQAKIDRALTRKERTVLRRAGGFTRQVVRRSMRKAPKRKRITSGPPRYRRGDLRKVFFYYEPRRRSVTIGPVPYRRTLTTRPRRRRSGASLLEFGGSAQVKTERRQNPWRRARFRKRAFMAPAMPKAIGKLKQLIKTVPFR